MEQNIVLGYLENILGKSHKRARQNYAFNCPKCNHRKPKLEINLETNEKGENPFECWVCKFRGRTIKSLLEQVGIPKEHALEVLKYVHKGTSREYRQVKQIELPKEFTPLNKTSEISVIGKKVKKYLLSRGVSKEDIIKHNIGYCTTGEYGGRIIIPSYNCYNNLNYFTSRSYENHFNKYKNPEEDKNTVIIFENLINWKRPIILVEGVFDAIAGKRNCIPLLGKSLPKVLLKKLIEEQKVEDVYVALDQDAEKQALVISETLLSFGKRVFFVRLQGKDPSQMGFESFTKTLQQAEELNLNSILRYKLR